MEILTPIITSLGPETVKSWGSFTTVLVLLGIAIWWQSKTILALKIKTDQLQAQVDRLQEARLQDAREMTRVVEQATAATNARAQNDSLYQEVLRHIVKTMAPVIQESARSP